MKLSVILLFDIEMHVIVSFSAVHCIAYVTVILESEEVVIRLYFALVYDLSEELNKL